MAHNPLRTGLAITFHACRCRVHRIPPRVSDDPDTSLCRTGWGELVEMICPTAKAEYFCEGGWTGNSSGNPSGKSVALEASVNHAVLRDTRSNRPLAKRLGHVAEAVERGLQTFDDFGRDFVGWRQQIGIVERVILYPENVEIDLVPRQQGFEGKPSELFSLLALGTMAGAVAGDEIIEISPYHGAFFQREALVGAQVVDPKILGC